MGLFGMIETKGGHSRLLPPRPGDPCDAAACEFIVVHIQAQSTDRNVDFDHVPALDALENCIEDAALTARNGANITAKTLQARARRVYNISAAQFDGHVHLGTEKVVRLFKFLAARS